ncbi:DUF4102 domain-containing protein [Salmonella enterica subsp. enterica serovar Abony]|nr:DUF4102 domain-containing protein [Salmonella enterica]EBE3482127.1 DUF4102 domain-containing protein [Salmonella enterica subsp. enterica serovar Heidelberg]EBX4895263.1 DUF4102 domain-containing protein [Salmonella enterica subsp. enterica serovar Abony]EAT1394920.1 DUF4102 domain-containing protein [Salmonella enterica]EAT2096175.1 DUF4102 domain-containing protein [Salmonella enterica]
MISLGVYPTITLADVSSRRDDARKLVAEGKSCDPTCVIWAQP